MTFRTSIELLDAATGGSKSGPPIASFKVTCASGIMLRLAAIVSKYEGILTIQYDEFKLGVYPLFYPTNAKGLPPSISMEIKSDSGLRSLKDEAVRVWDAGFADAFKRSDWMHTLGVHPCVSDRLLEPFLFLTCHIVVPNRVGEFLVDCINDLGCPDLRILGYRGTVKFIAHEKPVAKLFDAKHGEYVYHEKWFNGASHQDPEVIEYKLSELLLDRPVWAA